MTLRIYNHFFSFLYNSFLYLYIERLCSWTMTLHISNRVCFLLLFIWSIYLFYLLRDCVHAWWLCIFLIVIFFLLFVYLFISLYFVRLSSCVMTLYISNRNFVFLLIHSFILLFLFFKRLCSCVMLHILRPFRLFVCLFYSLYIWFDDLLLSGNIDVTARVTLPW